MQHEGAESGRGRAVLSSFLLREGMDGTSVDGLLARLEPIFVIADRGEYRPALPDGAAPAVLAAIASAAPPVLGMRVVRLSALRAVPTHGGRSRLLGSLGADLRHGIWIEVWRRDADTLRSVLGDERKAALWDACSAALFIRLRAAFDAALVPAVGYDLALHAWNSVEESVFYHLGLALSGEADRAARLAPLLAVLPSAVPLCRVRGDAGTWLVLAD